MAKAVVLKTNSGIKICGCTQCSNGAWFNADGCYKYCQEDTVFLSAHQASKLVLTSATLGHEKQGEDWYKHRENFIDVDIPFECTQSYVDQ